MTLTRSDVFPRTFGPYLLLSSFGRGGMGEVFLAKKRAVSDIDRLCIVKTLRGNLAEHQEYVRRFLDEARIVVQLNHSNICQVLEAGRLGPDYFLSMEFIPGVNLKDLAGDLRLAGLPMEPGLALFIGEQTAAALAYAHRFKSPVSGEHLRVIHRDVSPANVMVSFEGEVKLIDFGLAESTLKTQETETRLVMGKVAYMAPEQARGDELDGTVDEFAAAVVVYEALTGDRFYGDMNTHQVWQVVGQGGFKPRMWGGLPADVKTVLAKALAAEARDRFSTCDEFAKALDDVRARNYPHSSRSALRDLMTKLYADRAEAQRDLIASFADLRAPDAAAVAFDIRDVDATQGSAPATRAGSASSQGTEPWRSSPSDANEPAHAASAMTIRRPATSGTNTGNVAGPAAAGPAVVAVASPPIEASASMQALSSSPSPSLSPSSSAPPPQLSATMPVVRDTVTLKAVPSAGVASTGDSDALAIPPPNNAGRVLAAAAVIGVVAVAAVVLWPRAENHDTQLVDSGVAPTINVNFAHDAGVVALAADAGTVDTVVDAVVDAGATTSTKPRDGKHVVAHHDPPTTTTTTTTTTPTTTTTTTTPTTTPPTTSPTTTTPVVTTAPEGPPTLSLQAAEAYLRKCAATGKKDIPADVFTMLEKPGGNPERKRTLVDTWVPKCWAAGVRQ